MTYVDYIVIRESVTRCVIKGSSNSNNIVINRDANNHRRDNKNNEWKRKMWYKVCCGQMK